VFPDCDYRGSVPPGAHESALFGASDLTTLGLKVENLFRLQPFVPTTELSSTVLDGITRGLTSTFQLVPALWREVEDQERRLFRFTEDQLNILKVLQSHVRAAILGVAGSGKTVLAIAKARSFADEGKRVLFLCFNEMLAEWLRLQLPAAYCDSVSIRNYHKLCHEWVKAAGLVWPKAVDEAAFFRSEAPKLLEQAIDLLPERCFDAVVVDEGQDFMPAWWDTVELINKRPTEGPLYIFYDPDQQIFQATAASMPDLGAPFLLPFNCRNTERIASRCGEILGKRIPVNRGAPEGRAPKLIEAPSSEQQIKEVERQIKEWMTPSIGLKSNQVAVVTRGKVQNSSLAGVRSLAGYSVTENLSEWRSGAGILLTSLYRFKGLEADALIVADVIQPDPQAAHGGFRPQHLYVACSRAKHLLTIVSLSEEWI
jgi:superfamily I DNA and RNA helicase